jgi:hypothetical protein
MMSTVSRWKEHCVARTLVGVQELIQFAVRFDGSGILRPCDLVQQANQADNLIEKVLNLCLLLEGPSEPFARRCDLFSDPGSRLIPCAILCAGGRLIRLIETGVQLRTGVFDAKESRLHVVKDALVVKDRMMVR